MYNFEIIQKNYKETSPPRDFIPKKLSNVSIKKISTMISNNKIIYSVNYLNNVLTIRIADNEDIYSGMLLTNNIEYYIILNNNINNNICSAIKLDYYKLYNNIHNIGNKIPLGKIITFYTINNLNTFKFESNYYVNITNNVDNNFFILKSIINIPLFNNI
jgi:hypothetical protein